MWEGGVKGKQRDQSAQKGKMLARESAVERECEKEKEVEEGGGRKKKHKLRERGKREKES